MTPMGGWWDTRVAALGRGVRPLISRPWTTVLAAAVVQVGAAIVAALFDPTSTFSTCREVILLAAIGAAAAQGYRAGLAAMAIGSVVFVSFVELEAPSIASAATFQPLPIGLLAILITAAVRVRLRARSEALRHQETRVLESAAAQRAALDAIIVRTESFLDGLSAQWTYDAIAATARESFGADLAILWRIEDERAIAAAATMDPSLFTVDRVEDAPLVHPDIARGIRPVFLPLNTQEARSYGLDRPLLTLGMRSALKIPVLSHGTTMILTVAWADAIPPPGHSELLVAQRFGAQAAIGIEQAEAAEAQREADELHARLEAGLLPRVAVARAGVAVSIRYLPGEDRLLVGGDFLDVLDLPDGRVGVIVGDVAGHGASAAALGAVLRAGWRTLGLVGTKPVDVMETLNRLTLAERASPETFVTAVCAWIDPDARSVELSLAGHPPPIAVGPSARLLEATVSPALGAREQGDWAIETTTLDDPWSLVFLTDGVPEARRSSGGDVRIGLDGVVEWLAGRTAGAPADRQVIDELLAFAEAENGGALTDDVTVVSVWSTTASAAAWDRGDALTAAAGA
jgi:serine phosphatase RsbU (regulator of sigma subunit)